MDATANGYRLYHFSSSCQRGTSTVCPAAVFALAPNHAGQRVSYYGRYCKAGRCITDKGSYRLNKKSQATVHIFYGSSQVIGFALYLRFTFPGDSDHKVSASKVVKERSPRNKTEDLAGPDATPRFVPGGWDSNFGVGRDGVMPSRPV